ncbi:MAG TPA: hypothetical protein VNX27_09765 [Chthoniobacterales bacterium]|jgi:hypothetical protein|nr:hypothetical protein [Chthoniobacterales bacterium]
MKKLTLTFCALFALFAAAPAIFADGPEQYSGKKEVMQPAPPVCDFYRAHEWDLSIWGAYFFASDTGQFNVPEVDPFAATGTDNDPSTVDILTGFNQEQLIDNHGERVNIGRVSKNQLFARDNTQGGGLDVKYFWSRYFGVGLEGLGIAAKTNFAGGGLATLTGRYPFGRFAPYIWGGLGFIDGGGTTYKFFNEKAVRTATGETLPGGAAILFPGNVSPYQGEPFVVNEQEFWTTDAVYNTHIRALGQLGAGLEFRVTCHIGLMADFSWNFVFGQNHSDKTTLITEQGSDITNFGGTPIAVTPVINTAVALKPGQGSDNQDFGMVRFGVTFSY